jgi:hypothetical protein
MIAKIPPFSAQAHIWRGFVAIFVAALGMLAGCGDVSNNPHPPGSEASNTLFVPFTKRSPKHLDPTSSYSNDETPYTYQVYEPPYAYHYLKRPYELIGRSAQSVVAPKYLDKAGAVLPDDAPGEQIAETVFELKIKPGILFAPHPALPRMPGATTCTTTSGGRHGRQIPDH